MEENKKGYNVLYLVVGIATLVVAIIGATFAYFSATATDDSTVTGDIAEAGGLVVTVKSITYGNDNTASGNKIIPLNLITNQTLKEGSDSEYVDATSQFSQAITNKCVDDLGNNICEVYKITVANQSATSTVQVRGTLNLTSTAKNMYWKLIDATTTTTTVGETADVEVLDTATEQDHYVEVAQGAAGNLTIDENGAAANLSLAGSGTKDFYVIVWLEEMGTAQETDDASTAESTKTYSGAITFDGVDANGFKSGVTATFLS